MIELVASQQQRKFGLDKRDTLAALLPGMRCALCLSRRVSEKPLHSDTPDGDPGLNYLCAGYKAFFHHIDFAMKLMAGLIRREREAREVMQILDRAFTGVERNDPCPCGSGRKFKQCHGQPQPQPSSKPLPAPQSRSGAAGQFS